MNNVLKKLSLKSFFICFIAVACVGIIYNILGNKSEKYNLSRFSLDKINKEVQLVPILVIGSGPAGYAAGLYGARAAVHTVVFEGYQPGGLLTTTSYVENWPGIIKTLGKQIMLQAKQQAESFGALMVEDSIKKVDFSSWPYKVFTSSGKEIQALTVVIATGARSKELGVKGEAAYWSKGVTACAVCDAPAFKGKNVIVVGGGDSAIEEATYLSVFASSVSVAVRSDKMRASAAMQKRLPDYKNIKVLYNTSINEILGDGKEVKSIELIDNKTKVLTKVPMDGVFLAAGHLPNSDLFKNHLEIDSLGYIVINNLTQETSKPGVFSAGDVSDKFYKQAGVAAGDGIKAALGAIAFLQDIGFNEAVSKKNASMLFKNEVVKPIVVAKVTPVRSIDSLSELDKLIKKEKVLVVDCYGTWCPPCKRMMPIVESASNKFTGKATIVKVDVDKAPDISKKYSIRSLPTFMVFKNGKLVSTQTGAMFENGVFDNFINKNL